jgi:pimeloyl-ACP methyl ester carboxylesterase
MSQRPLLTPYRATGSDAAILLIHGFNAEANRTWGPFSQLLSSCPALDGWDLLGISYQTSLAPDLRGIWTGDPDLQTLASFLYTALTTGKLGQYKALVFLAHSMGGLIVQRVLLDHADLVQRTSHVLLFGTPSNGLRKAGWLRLVKHQARDMEAGSAFVRRLRDDWRRSWPDQPPFGFWAVAGDSDLFVSVASSLDPFPFSQQWVIPGDHLSIVKPQSTTDLAIQLVVRAIQGEAAPAGPWNAARVALQRLDFQRAVDILHPHASELDDHHLVQLALALEGLGRGDAALTVLEQAGLRGNDARGVLAGRLKRRWLREGRQADWQQALALYQQAFDDAVDQGDHHQAYYHGINVCFLLCAAGSEVDQAAAAMAHRVLQHCSQVKPGFWSLGTAAEAHLLLGHTTAALADYRAAVALEPPPQPREMESMHAQACRLATLLGHHAAVNELDAIFRGG